MKYPNHPGFPRLLALLIFCTCLLPTGKVSGQNVQFGYAILGVESVEFRGNTIRVDSFDSSNPAASVAGAYSPLYARDNAVVATANNDGFLSLGNATIAGFVSPPAVLGINGAVGDLAYLSSGGTGIQEGRLISVPHLYLNEVEVPFAGGASPIVNATILTPVITTSSNILGTSPTFDPLPQTDVVITNLTQINSTNFPEPGTYIGSITTNWVQLTTTDFPSGPYLSLTTNTLVETSFDYPPTGTYVGGVITTIVTMREKVQPAEGTYIPGTLRKEGAWWFYDVYQYHFSKITGYTYYGNPSYTFHVPSSYTFIAIVYSTNYVGETFNYVFDNGNYTVPQLSGNVLVRGNASVHVTDNLSSTSTDRIQVNPSANLKLYCSSSTASFGVNAIQNKTGKAANFLIYATPQNSSMTLTSLDALACIYAPHTHLSIAGGGNDTLDFVGSIIVKSLTVNGNVHFHYDEALNPGGTAWEIPLAIKPQPAHKILAPNSVAVLSFAYTGSGPVTSQWWKDGEPLILPADGIQQTSVASLQLVSSYPEVAGNYHLVLSNSLGAVTSHVVTVSIGQAPSIQSITAEQLLVSGDPLALALTAAGTAPLSYQWFLNGNPVTQGTNDSLVRPSVTFADAGNFHVVVGNAYGTITSGVLRVVVAGDISPASSEKLSGESIILSANPSDTNGLTFQWHHNGNTIPGATNLSLTLDDLHPDDSGSYSVTIFNGLAQVTNSPAALDVNGAPRLNAELSDYPANYGDDISFTVSADGVMPLSYQWFREGLAIDGATDAALALGNVTLDDEGLYSVTITNSYGILSAAASLEVSLALPQITQDPADQTVSVGGNISFTVSASSPAPIHYQWQHNGKGLAGATTATLSLPNVNYLQRGTYQCVLSNAAGAVTSGEALLAVELPPSPFLQAAGVYNGLFASKDGVAHDTAGFFTLKIRTNGRFSGKLLLDGDAVSTTGLFNSNGVATATVNRSKKGKTALSLQLHLDFDKTVAGQVIHSDWQSDLTAFLAIRTTNTVEEVDGRYTFLLPMNEPTMAGPNGTGYSLIKVKRGKISAAGFLADGNPLKQSIHYTTNGYWPFYSQHYPGTNYVTNSSGSIKIVKSNRGSTIGWLSLSNQTPSGTLHWQMPSGANRHYAGGLTNSAEIIGSVFIPAVKTRAVEITNGIISFSGGSLMAPFTNEFFLRTNNSVQVTVTNKPMRLSFSPTTGAISGNFTDTTNRVVFRGAILQNQRFGAGFFSPTNNGGSLLVESLAD